jgi:hypothetical protein
METKRKSILLLIATGLIFLLGITRGIGGIIYLFSDDKTLEALNNSITLVVSLVISFILLSAASFITAISIFGHNKKLLLTGFLFTLIFVVSGGPNENFPLNNTTIQEIIINIIAIVIIISLLIFSKKALEKTEKD